MQLTFINKDEYPITLDPKHIQKILGSGRSQTYRFLNNNPPFPILRIGGSIKVYKEVFFKWLENELHSVENIKVNKSGQATKIKYLGKEYVLQESS